MKRKHLICIIIVQVITILGICLGLLLLSNKDNTANYRESSDSRDDFYMYINKETFDRRDIPTTMGGWDNFSDIQSDVYIKMYKIVDDLVKDGSADKLKKYYDTFIDSEARDKIGTTPIDGYINRVKQVNSIEDYLDLTLDLKKQGVYDFALNFQVTKDFRDSSKMILMLDAYPCYVYTDSSYDAMLQLAIDESRETLELYGYDKDEVSNILSEAIEYDRKTCENTMSVTDWQDTKNINVISSIEELKKIYSNIDIEYYLNELGLGDIEELIIVDKQFHKNVNDTLTVEYLDILKNELISNIIDEYICYMSTEFYNSYQEFQNKLNGTVGIKDLDEFVLEDIQENFESYITERFIKDYFSESDKEYIEDMIEEIRDYYIKSIEKNDWLEESTKKEAIKKLKALKIRVGYPDELIIKAERYDIKSYSEGGNAVTNKTAINKAEWERDLDLLFERDTYDGWENIPLLEVNAYYNPTDNSINFPLAISYTVDDSESYYYNLGKIGMIIAHEMSHAFDANGALYDENGNMSNWWTDEDMEEYEKRTDKIVDYYSNFTNPYGESVNGKLTLSENIADLGAVECITGIAKEKNATKEELKELYESFASFWANEYNESISKKQILTDSHSPNNVRVNATLSSNDLFYETYNIEEGDGMYYAKEDRVKLW